MGYSFIAIIVDILLALGIIYLYYKINKLEADTIDAFTQVTSPQ